MSFPKQMFQAFLNEYDSAFAILEHENGSYYFKEHNQVFQVFFNERCDQSLHSFLKQFSLHTKDQKEVFHTLTNEYRDYQILLNTLQGVKTFLCQLKYFKVEDHSYVSIEFNLQSQYAESSDINLKFLELSQKVAKIGSWKISSDLKTPIWTRSLKDIFELDEKFKPDYDFGLNLFKENEDQQKLNSLLIKTSETGEGFTFVSKIITKNNTEKWVEVKAEAEIKHQKIISVFGTLQDITSEKEYQLKLEKQNAFISTTLDNLPIGLVLNEIDTGQATYANHAFQKIYGYNKDEVEGVDQFFEKVYPDPVYREEIKTKILSDLKSGDPEKMQWQNIRVTSSNGKTKYVNAKNIPVFDQNIMISTVTDVTETYLANQKTKELRDRFLYASKAVSDAIWDYDVVNNTRFWSKSYQSIFNVDLESTSVTEEFWKQHIHPNDLNGVFNSFTEALENNQTTHWSCYYRFKNAEDNYAYVFDNAYIIRDQNGKATRVVGALKDVTEQRAKTEHLKLLESVVENTGDAILITDAEQLEYPGPKIVFANPSFLKMTGYSLKEVIGKTPRMLQGPNTNQEAVKLMSKQLKDYTSFDIDILNYNKDKQEFWVNLSFSPIANSEGEYLHYVCIQKEITEKKSKELQLKLFKETYAVFQKFKNVNQSLQQVFSAIKSYAEFNLGELWLFNDHDQLPELIYSSNSKNESEVQKNKRRESPLFREEFYEDIWYASEIIQHNQVPEHKILNTSKHSSPVTCFSVPLLYNSEIIGVLLMAYKNFNKRSSFIHTLFEEYRRHIGSEIKRKQTEDELNQIIDNAPDFICIAEKNGFLKRVNPFSSKLLGYTEAEFLSTPVIEFLHPEDQSVVSHIFDQKALEEDQFYLENRVKAKDNTYLHIAWSISQSETTGMFYCVGKNITDKIKAQQEIEANKTKFELISKTTNDALWEFDLKEELIYWGDGFERLFGYSKANFPETEKAWLSLIHKKDRTSVKENFNAAIKNPDISFWKDAYRFIDHSGQYKYVLDHGYIIRNDKGKATSIIGAMQDFTTYKTQENELKQLNNRLQQRARELKKSNQELEQFAYVASHDLQEPLRMITGFLTQLDKKYRTVFDQKAQQYVYFALDGAERMREIILDLLKFSKVDHRTLITQELVDVNLVIEEVLLLLKGSIEETKAEITWDDLPNFYATKLQIRQVFQNLIDNAIKYTEASKTPKISISGFKKANTIEFSVKDNAITIKKSQYHDIFTIFTRLSNSTEIKGTGMGLSITKKIIDNLGGQIWIEPNSKGNTFKFTIPLNQTE